MSWTIYVSHDEYYLSEPRMEFVDSKGKLLPGSFLLTIPRR